jgi:hypothetical protein
MGDGNRTLFSSNTPLEARIFKFQWNNGQGSVIRMLASPTLHFPRPFGNSVELKPSELSKLSLSEALFPSLQYHNSEFSLGYFPLVCVQSDFYILLPAWRLGDT